MHRRDLSLHAHTSGGKGGADQILSAHANASRTDTKADPITVISDDLFASIDRCPLVSAQDHAIRTYHRHQCPTDAFDSSFPHIPLVSAVIKNGSLAYFLNVVHFMQARCLQ